MKKSLIFFAVFLLAISMVAADDVILRLSQATNAHGELASQGNYATEILYSDIFGTNYTGTNEYNCTGSNTILKLSSLTNAHAEDPTGTNYANDVCYGDLSCSLVDGDCSNASVCLVKLSGTTNAHLETCDNTNYQYSICCGAGDAPCEAITTRDSCWASSNNCTWTPPGTTSNPDGGCCEGDLIWNSKMGLCDPSAGNICNNVWQVDNQIFGTTYRISGSNYQYCAQVTSGLSYGFWYDVNKF